MHDLAGGPACGPALGETRFVSNCARYRLRLVTTKNAAYRPAQLVIDKARKNWTVATNQEDGELLGALGTMTTGSSDELDILERVRKSLGADYVPSEDEEYMSLKQQDFFRKLLLEWKGSIHSASSATLQSLQDGPIRDADLNDRASSETDWSIELRTRDRQRKLIAKIDSAMRKIDEGEYGFCEVTGDEIGLKRLMARPVATMTVEAQEAHERREKISRDD